jgi:hypothetical protein
MPCIKVVLHYRRLIDLFEMYMPHMFLASNLNGPPSLAHKTSPHSHGIWYTPGTLRPKSSLTVLSMYVFHSWNVKSLDVVFCQKPANFVCNGFLIRYDSYTGRFFIT